MHGISFQSAYNFGDLVQFETDEHESQEGTITDITLSDDGAVHYGILIDPESGGHFGIYPEKMRLIKKAAEL